MDILNVILLSLFSLIALFILTKLMGYRQMSEMSMFDYINGITIGSIAAEMATSLEKDWWLPPDCHGRLCPGRHCSFLYFRQIHGRPSSDLRQTFDSDGP